MTIAIFGKFQLGTNEEFVFADDDSATKAWIQYENDTQETQNAIYWCAKYMISEKKDGQLKFYNFKKVDDLNKVKHDEYLITETVKEHMV